MAETTPFPAKHYPVFPSPTLAEDILNTVETLICVVDGNGELVYVSPAVERMLGYPACDMLGEGWWERAYSGDPEFGRAVRDRVTRTARGELPVQAEAHTGRVFTAAGAERWVAWRDAKGPADLMIGVGQDITELHKAEALIEKREHDFHAVFENASDGMLILSEGWIYEQVNDSACRIFGVKRQQLLGREHGSLLNSTIDVHRFRQQGLEFGHYQVEAEFVRPDGEIRRLEVALTTNFRPGHHLMILRDVTERRKLEVQLSEAHRLEAVGRLAGGVAHDFNNMLTAIQGYAELLQRKLKDETFQRYVESILGAAHRAAQTTQQLLAFSRKQMLQPKLLDLNQAIADTMVLVQRLIGEDIELMLLLSPGPLKVLVDPGQLGQILMNLVVNARDALPGGGKIIIETQRMGLDDEYVLRHVQVHPGDYAMIAVSDTGVGIPREIMAHIFEPFFTTKEKGKGTGLGLATVYGIVKQSGGYVWAYSEPGQGTSFKIYLPLIAKDAVMQPGQNKETILVIEDDETVLSVTMQALEAEGYRVLAARDGTEALAVCQQWREKIDVVLTDVMADGMSGEDLMGYFAVKYPQLAVVHMSGFARVRLEQAHTLFPDALFLAKPFTAAQLREAIQQALQRRAAVSADSHQE